MITAREALLKLTTDINDIAKTAHVAACSATDWTTFDYVGTNTKAQLEIRKLVAAYKELVQTDAIPGVSKKKFTLSQVKEHKTAAEALHVSLHYYEVFSPLVDGKGRGSDIRFLVTMTERLLKSLKLGHYPG